MYLKILSFSNYVPNNRNVNEKKHATTNCNQIRQFFFYDIEQQNKNAHSVHNVLYVEYLHTQLFVRLLSLLSSKVYLNLKKKHENLSNTPT